MMNKKKLCIFRQPSVPFMTVFIQCEKRESRPPRKFGFKVIEFQTHFFIIFSIVFLLFPQPFSSKNSKIRGKSLMFKQIPATPFCKQTSLVEAVFWSLAANEHKLKQEKILNVHVLFSLLHFMTKNMLKSFSSGFKDTPTQIKGS